MAAKKVALHSAKAQQAPKAATFASLEEAFSPYGEPYEQDDDAGRNMFNIERIVRACGLLLFQCSEEGNEPILPQIANGLCFVLDQCGDRIRAAEHRRVQIERERKSDADRRLQIAPAKRSA